MFVLIGPVYGFRDKLAADPSLGAWDIVVPTLVTAVAIALASSGSYVINDLVDREVDRLHVRKRHRPIAAGLVGTLEAKVLAAVLFAASGVAIASLPSDVRGWVAAIAGLYVANVLAYSLHFKSRPIADVISLALGFVLRVLAGCAAVAITPSTWLLNVTFFLAMFLGFGKRLGERRVLSTSGAPASTLHRSVQGRYTEDFLRTAVVVTAVAALLTYAAYVQDRDTVTAASPFAFDLLWLTLLPATYGLLRCIVLLEAGRYDDPTELAFRDRAVALAVLVFGSVTVAVLLAWHAAGG